MLSNHAVQSSSFMKILGIDGGGTKTVCVLMNETGEILGRGIAGPSNYQSVGIETAQNSIKMAINAAITTNNIPPVKIEAIGLGLAGVGRSEDIQTVQNFLEPFRSDLQVKPEHVFITGDHMIALMGGLGHNVGIVAIAGTGSLVFGQNARGQTKRVGGWGYLLGDEGSGYNIALRGLQATLKAYDGRLPTTDLIQRFQTHLGLEHIEGLIEVVYRRGWTVGQIAALAPIVDQAAAEGDRIAQEIINDAADALILGTKVVMADLFDTVEGVEIVTLGGVWKSIGHFRQRFKIGINAIAPASSIIWPRHEAAYGAGLWVLQQLNSV